MSDRNPSAGSDDAYVSHRFDAPPEIVFAAWTDPEQVARWWAPRGFEIPPESVDIEPRVGGRFHLDMVEVSGPGRFRYRAEIVELVEPELLALKGEPIDGTDIEVTITRVELVAEGGGTRMTVTSGPFTREARENAQTGWGELVVKLERVLAAGPARRELEAFYLRYHRCCNEHAFERLDEFVADDVEINGERRGLQGYVDSLEEVVRAFPDFRWELRHLVIDGSWIAAHLLDEGTHPDGRVVTTHEFAVYRVAAGKIAEVWGDLRTAELIART